MSPFVMALHTRSARGSQVEQGINPAQIRFRSRAATGANLICINACGSPFVRC
jgi:hypothetical protein